MKEVMKKLKYLIIIAMTLMAISCKKDFLDMQQLYQKTDASYYSNPGEVEQGLTGIYSCLTTSAGADEPIFLAELLSDDRFGGGGTNDLQFHATDAFASSGVDMYLEMYNDAYKGIFRSNLLLKRFSNADYKFDTVSKNQDHGEAYFLRAYYYFRLAEFFGTIPMPLDPAPSNLPKAKVDDLFAQIATDLKSAIEIMPAIPFTSIPTSRLGHATKWAAEGLMARVFLFYTGYYSKDALPLPGGGSITKAQVVTWVDDCVANSGHGLIPDFRNLWPYTYSSPLGPSYPYVAHNHLHWIGDSTNIETVFAIKFSPYGGWSAPSQELYYSNQLVLYMGMRLPQIYAPWAQGWGGGPVSPLLWDSFEPNDIRQVGSILNVNINDTFNEGDFVKHYKWGADNQYQETGIWQKKYIPVQVPDTGSKSYGKLIGMFCVMYGAPNNYQLWNMQDEVLIRFADILLMGAELGSTKAQTYFDAVRIRAGLTSKPVTLDNIKLERRHELAFEGLRYFDLLRWHDEVDAFSKLVNIPIKNAGVAATYTATYRPETGGFLPIPESQVTNSAGVLLQNPGW